MTRTNPLVGAVGEFASIVNTIVNDGYITYNTVQVSGTKRVSNGWSARLSYAFSRGRGNTPTGQAAVAESQLLGELNLDREYGPTNVDRPHILTVSGSYDVPKTGGLKVSAVYSARSGLPFSLRDTTFDADRNGSDSKTNTWPPALTPVSVRIRTRLTTRAAATVGAVPITSVSTCVWATGSAWAVAGRLTRFWISSTRRTSRISQIRTMIAA